MNVLYSIIPLILLGLTPLAFAEVDHGLNYDRAVVGSSNGHNVIKHTFLQYERIKDGDVYKDYVVTDLPNAIMIDTATERITLDKTTCGFSLHENGSSSPAISDSVIAFNEVRLSNSRNAITSLNNASCTASFDSATNALIAQRSGAGVGILTYKYIFDNGSWKTQMEVTNKGVFSNRVFSFDQTVDINSDVIMIGSTSYDIDTISGNIINRANIQSSDGNVIDFLNGFRYDLDIGYAYVESFTVIDTGSNSSKIIFHFSNHDTVLLPNETLVIDPTYSSTSPTAFGYVTDAGNNNVCDGLTSVTKTTSPDPTQVATFSTSQSIDCRYVYFDYDISSIPDTSVIDDVSVQFHVSTVSSARNCDFRSMAAVRGSDTGSNIFTAIHTGTTFVSNDSTCASTGTSLSVDLGATADSEVTSRLAGDFFTFGIRQNIITLDASDHYSEFETSGGTPDFTLVITYTLTVASPDAVDDLTSPNQSYGSVDLLWTQPNLNNGTLSGYQINYTTPWGDPLTIITNDTGTTDVSSVVSGLSLGTDYSFRVSAYTDGGVNATSPPATILNVTTYGNFTIGTVFLNQTNTQVLPITFEEQSINSTSKFLNVTFANTYDMECNFHYKFANINNTYGNLTSYAVSTTLNETAFIFNDADNEVIDVYCYDTVSGEDGDYLLRQSSFALLDQINAFRSGDYGTEGKIGVFDFVTIIAVIISMIGLNRVNESVGAIFNIAMLGALAYFGIIELPTVMFGMLAVVIVFIITSTKKD